MISLSKISTLWFKYSKKLIAPFKFQEDEFVPADDAVVTGEETMRVLAKCSNGESIQLMRLKFSQLRSWHKFFARPISIFFCALLFWILFAAFVPHYERNGSVNIKTVHEKSIEYRTAMKNAYKFEERAIHETQELLAREKDPAICDILKKNLESKLSSNYKRSVASVVFKIDRTIENVAENMGIGKVYIGDDSFLDTIDLTEQVIAKLNEGSEKALNSNALFHDNVTVQLKAENSPKGFVDKIDNDDKSPYTTPIKPNEKIKDKVSQCINVTQKNSKNCGEAKEKNTVLPKLRGTSGNKENTKSSQHTIIGNSVNISPVAGKTKKDKKIEHQQQTVKQKSVELANSVTDNEPIDKKPAQSRENVIIQFSAGTKKDSLSSEIAMVKRNGITGAYIEKGPFKHGVQFWRARVMVNANDVRKIKSQLTQMGKQSFVVR